MKITDIKHRYELPEFLNENNLCEVGAEIGVSRGTFSNRLLRQWTGTLLYSVDSWIRKDINHGNNLYMEAKNKLQQYGDRSIILRMTSLEASQIIEDSSLDFCFIDANHYYHCVLEDCNLWWPKIKSGGILCGHDYSYDKKVWEDRARPFPHPGVKLAVDKFTNSNKLDLYHDTRPTYHESSWYTMKNA